MASRTAFEILAAIHQGLEGKGPGETIALLKLRMEALSTVDHATLDAFEEESEHDLVPNVFPTADQQKATIKSAFALFPDLNAAPADVKLDFEPFNLKYENTLDVANWIVQRGPVRLSQIAGTDMYRDAVRAVQRSHEMKGQSWSSSTAFRYTIPECGDDQPIRLAVFGDQGMETGPVKWIAPQMATWLGKGPRDRSLALHLGDVYYSGDDNEVKRYVLDMKPVCEVAELWSIPGDHERFTRGGAPFWDALDGLRNAGKTRQQGGYFVLENSEFQLVALDAFAEPYARLPRDEAPNAGDRKRFPGHAQRGWLGGAMAGPGATRTNLFFSQAPPHKPRTGLSTHFGQDVKDLLGEAAQKRIHGWFWGDVHNAGVYLPTTQRPYVSFLAGHAGRPVPIPPQPNPEANCIFWETAPRYPVEWLPGLPIAVGSADAHYLAMQRKRLRNGWVQAELHKGGIVKLCYVDWMGNPRFSGTLTRVGGHATLSPDAVPALLS